MIQVQEVAKHFGGRTLFSGVTWRIDPGQRIALVGPNGAGKSTLAKMLAGTLVPDDGAVSRSRGFRVGYLQQEIDTATEGTVLEHALDAFGEVRKLTREVAELEGRLAEGSDAAVLNALGAKQARLEALDAYSIEGKSKRILAGLGFAESDFERPASELSGGWLMRMALARLLLEAPDLLVLDEPTNHLDLETLEWLEGFLATFPGSLLVISHDRWFINRIARLVAELELGRLTLYHGNFDAYLEAKAERRAQQIKMAKAVDREVAALERFIERFRAKNTKAKAAKSKQKQLDRIERVEIDATATTMKGFRFPQPPRSGKVVMELDALVKRYDDLVVYDGLDLVLYAKKKVALVGPNGAGKSTLLKILAGALAFEGGARKLGAGVSVQYFAQHQLDALDPSKTAYQEMAHQASDEAMPRVRSILGAFLFRGKDVDKQVSVLSGGEKSRLALAKMLLEPANLLLLDEPTNHLDLASREMLEAALDDFEGTIVFISHDRAFINAVADEVWEVQGGTVRAYPGSWDYYAWKRSEERVQAAAAPTPGQSDGAQSSRLSRREQKRIEAELRNACHRETKATKARLEVVETAVAELEEHLEAMEALAAEPGFFDDAERVREHYANEKTKRAELAALYEEWEELGQQIEEREAALQSELEARLGQALA